MILIWITFTIILLVPLILSLRGRGILGLSFATACLYGLGLAAVLFVNARPAGIASQALRMDTASTKDINRTFHDTYDVVAQVRASAVPTVIFGTIAATYWALIRWHTPIAQRLTIILFWALHVGILAMPALRFWEISVDMPHPDVDHEGGISAYTLATSLAVVLIYVGLVGLILSEIWSIIQRLRTRAL